MHFSSSLFSTLILMRKPWSIKRLVQALTPPLLFSLLTSLRENCVPQSKKTASIMRSVNKNVHKIALDPDWHCFRDGVSRAKVYGEWGCGASTLYALQQGLVDVLSFENDEKWANLIGGESTAHVVHVDVGEVGGWGWPRNYADRDNFIEYIEGPFRNIERNTDLWFIDGRFRIACFLTALAFSPKGTLIVFDDYESREHYKVVEEFLKPSYVKGRQALFEVPEKINRDKVLLERDRFLYVLD